MPATLRQDLEQVDKQTDVSAIAERLGCKTPAAKEFLRFSLANALLFDRKQQDYGPENIAKFGSFGIIVRMTDKFERMKNLFSQGRRRRAVNESISDSFRDVHNYANIALMLEGDKWPNQ